MLENVVSWNRCIFPLPLKWRVRKIFNRSPQLEYTICRGMKLIHPSSDMEQTSHILIVPRLSLLEGQRGSCERKIHFCLEIERKNQYRCVSIFMSREKQKQSRKLEEIREELGASRCERPSFILRLVWIPLLNIEHRL